MARNHPTPGPYSRQLRRGAINLADGRSRLGRFVRHLEAELVAHVGGAPSITQKLLIERVIKTRVLLDQLDERLTRDGWAIKDIRLHASLQDALRLASRELGLKPAAKPAPTLAEITAEIAAGRPGTKAA